MRDLQLHVLPSRTCQMANMLNSRRLEGLARSIRVKAHALIWALALAVTLGSGWVRFQTAAQVSAMQAQTWASLMGATAKQGLLRPQELQLALADAHSATASPALISLHNRAGLIVATNTAQPAWPTTTHTAVAIADGVSVGEANVSHSLLPVVATMLMAAVVSGLLAALAHALLRGSVRPGATSAPDRAEPNPRQETEDRLRIVFENSIDGIMTFTLDGTVLSCNPAAARLLTRDPTAVVGMRLSELIEPVPGAPDGAPFPTGLHETVAQACRWCDVPRRSDRQRVKFQGCCADDRVRPRHHRAPGRARPHGDAREFRQPHRSAEPGAVSRPSARGHEARQAQRPSDGLDVPRSGPLQGGQ